MHRTAVAIAALMPTQIVRPRAPGHAPDDVQVRFAGLTS